MKLLLLLFIPLLTYAADKVGPTAPSTPTDLAAQVEYSKRVAFFLGAQNMFMNSLTSEQKAMQENVTKREKAVQEALPAVSKSCPADTELDQQKLSQLEFSCNPKPKTK